MTTIVTGGAGFIGGNFIHYYLKSIRKIVLCGSTPGRGYTQLLFRCTQQKQEEGVTSKPGRKLACHNVGK